MFGSRNKIYYVFANDQDAFFTDSLLRFGVDDYLWLQLRKSGYENIFFVEDTPEGVTLRVTDANSADCYAGMCRFSGKKPQIWPVTVAVDPGILCGWLAGKKKSAAVTGPTAWVIRGTAFQKCFEHAPDLFDDFADNRCRGGDTIVLRLSMQLSAEELRLFTAESSIFFRKTAKGSCLSTPVYDMIHTKESVPVFDRLGIALGESLIQLSAISHARIWAMLRWVVFRLRMDPAEEQMQDYANFLYWYVYSPDLRAYTKDPIPRCATCRDLADYLMSAGAFQAIDERLAVLKSQAKGGYLPDILYRICPLRKDEDRSRIQITYDEQLLIWLSRLPYPADFTRIGTDPDISAYSYQRWLEMQQQVVKPNTHPIRQERLDNISAFMEFFHEARRNADIRTALRAADALCAAACQLYLPVGTEDRVRAYKVWLEVSREHYGLCCSLRARTGTVNRRRLLELAQQDLGVRTLFEKRRMYEDMLKSLENALLLPDSKFGHLLREAAQLLHRESFREEPSGDTSRASTQEEMDAVFREFEYLV